MCRGISFRRHQRERIIKRRVRIYTEYWGLDLKEYFYNNGTYGKFPVGKYSKGKVHCSCRMCRYEKFHSIEKDNIKEKLDLMEKDIKGYV